MSGSRRTRGVIDFPHNTARNQQAFHAPPIHDLGILIGQVGEARTDIHAEGSVHVRGELWSARSQSPIKMGSHVKVVARDGFILDVETEPETK